MTAALTASIRASGSRLFGGLRWSARTDVALAVICFVLAQVEVATYDDGHDLTRMLSAALATLPIAWRQRAPLAAMGFVAASWVIFHLWSGVSDDPLFEFAALPVIYSSGDQPQFRRAVCGLVVLLGAVAVTDVRSLGFFGFQFAVLWLTGRGVRIYRVQSTELRALAHRLEGEGETRERLAVAQERLRLADELHDTIADAVSVMVVQAGGAGQMVGREPDRARAALVAVQNSGREVIAQLQRVLCLLRRTARTLESETVDPAPSAAPARRSLHLITHSTWADMVLALFVVLLADPRMAHFDPLDSAVAFVAIMIRRFAPHTALLVAGAGTVAELLVFGALMTFATVAATMVAMYSVGADTATRRSVPAAATAVAAICALVALKFAADSAVLAAVWLAMPWFAGRRVRAYRRRADELRILTTRLAHERDARARLAVLEERARVARELHDSLAHAINVMVLQAGAAEQVLLPSPDRAQEAIRAIESHGRQAHDDLCRLLGFCDSGGCSPRVPQPGLAQLDTLFAEAGMPVTLRVSGRPARLPAGLDISAYRIVQEGLTNTLKHAGPVPATVTLDYGCEALSIEIRDPGIGSPPRLMQPAGRGGGHGLLGMRERTTLYGGALEAGPSSDGGFVVRARLPFDGTVT
jgi:signal transduction histidine kinase